MVNLVKREGIRRAKRPAERELSHLPRQALLDAVAGGEALLVLEVGRHEMPGVTNDAAPPNPASAAASA